MDFIGALKEVEEDFIRLLWEQNVPLVVMVTKLVEGTAVSVTQFFCTYTLIATYFICRYL